MNKLITLGAAVLLFANTAMANPIYEKSNVLLNQHSNHLPDGNSDSSRKTLEVKGVKDTEIEVEFKSKKAQKVVIDVLDEHGKTIKSRTFTKAGVHHFAFVGEQDKKYQVVVTSNGIVVLQNKTL
jgi:hypothetical protein